MKELQLTIMVLLLPVSVVLYYTLDLEPGFFNMLIALAGMIGLPAMFLAIQELDYR